MSRARSLDRVSHARGRRASAGRWLVCYTVRTRIAEVPRPKGRKRLDILSPIHLVIILALALLLFGPKRLPEIGQGLGKTIREFRKAMQDGSDAADKPAAPPTKEEELR